MQSIYRLFQISQLIFDHFINFLLIKGTRYSTYKETLLGFYASVLLLILSQAAVSSPISSSNLRLIIGNLFEVTEIQEGCHWSLKLVDDGRAPITEWAEYAADMITLMKGIEGQQIEVVNLNSLYTELYLLVNKGDVSLTKGEKEKTKQQSHICQLKAKFAPYYYPYASTGRLFLTTCIKSMSNPELPRTEMIEKLCRLIPKLQAGNENETIGMGDTIVNKCLSLPFGAMDREQKSLMMEVDMDPWTAQNIHETMEPDDQNSDNINITILDRISSAVVFSLNDIIHGKCGRYSGNSSQQEPYTYTTQSCYSSLLFYQPQTQELYPPCDSGRYEVRLGVNPLDPVEVVVTQLPKIYKEPETKTAIDLVLKEITEDMRVGDYELRAFMDKKKIIDNIVPHQIQRSQPAPKPQLNAIKILVSYIYKDDIDKKRENHKSVENHINRDISKILKHLNRNLQQDINHARTY